MMSPYFIKFNLFFIGALLQTTTLRANTNSSLTSKAQNWLKISPACETAPYRGNKPHRTLKEVTKGNTKFYFDFYCLNGKKQLQFTVLDKNLKVIFSSHIFEDQFIGAAQSIEQPGQILVWTGHELMFLNDLTSLSVEDSRSAALKNGYFRIFHELTKYTEVLRLQNGKADGEKLLIYRHQMTNHKYDSAGNQLNQNIDNQIIFRSKVDFYKDGIYQYGNEVMSGYRDWNNLKSISPEIKMKNLNYTGACSNSAFVSAEELIKNMNSASQAKSEDLWLTDANSKKFREMTTCSGGFQDMNRRSVNGLISVESTCFQQPFTGYVRLYDKSNGLLTKSAEYKNGKLHGLFAYAFNGVIEHQAYFNEGNLHSVCSRAVGVKFLVDRENAVKQSRSRTGLYGLSASWPSRDDYSVGAWYSPNFYTRDIGGGGFFVEAEYRKQKELNLGRVSAGPGFVAMAFTGYAMVGVGFNSTDVKSADITVGAGLLYFTGFVRPIYRFEEKNFIGEVGLKLVVPFGI